MPAEMDMDYSLEGVDDDDVIRLLPALKKDTADGHANGTGPMKIEAMEDGVDGRSGFN